jgi:subtilisin family serine protease
MSEKASNACAGSTIPHRYIVQWEDGSISLESGESDAAFRETFVDKKLHLIRHVDRDYRIKLSPATAVTTRSESLALDEVAGNPDLNWAANQVSADRVWSAGFVGAGVRVGVVDSMIDPTHVQLKKNVLSIAQFNEEENDSTLNIHGTHVAGIIAASAESGPVSGIAPGASLVGGQFLGNNGAGAIGDALLALDYVHKAGARIINMSWGGAPCVQNLKSVLQNLSNQGVLLVTASGNEGVNTDLEPSYPASFGFDSQINIAATTQQDYMTYFSNRGYRTVNVAAPGVRIFSTVPGDRVLAMDGTSMATPIVSGIAALLFSAEPTATAQQVKQAISLSVDVPDFELQVRSRGRVNALKALERLRSILSSK